MIGHYHRKIFRNQVTTTGYAFGYSGTGQDRQVPGMMEFALRPLSGKAGATSVQKGLWHFLPDAGADLPHVAAGIKFSGFGNRKKCFFVADLFQSQGGKNAHGVVRMRTQDLHQ
jgi:hypothetical protein